MPLGDRDFNRITDNVKKMFDGGADRARVDAYVAAEGVTADEIKAFNLSQRTQQVLDPNNITTISPEGTAQVQTKKQFKKGLPQPLTPAEKIEALGERALTGATFGLGGAISPAIGAAAGELFELFGKAEPKTFKERFKEQREEFKLRKQKLEKEKPITAIGTEIAGGLLTGGALARGLATVARPAVRAVAPPIARLLAGKGAIPAVGRAIGTGAGFGGAFGGGTALSEVIAGEQPVAEIPKRALKAGTIGAVAGGALSGAGQVIGGVGKVLARQFGGKRAIKSLAERAGREQLEKSVATRQPLLDIGDKRIINIAERAAAISDGAKERVVNRAIQQLEAQPQRLASKIDDVFSAKSTLQNLDEVTAKYAPLKKELYNKAYQSPIDVAAKTGSINKIGELLKRPIFKDASKELKDISKVTGELIPENLIDDINTKNLDLLKRGIDTLIEKETDRVTQTLSNKGRLLTGLRKEFVDLIDDINPNYKLARKVASDEFGIKNAMREAKKVFKKRPEQIKREFDALADAEKEAYLIGVKDELPDKISRAATSKERRVAENVFKFSEDFKLRQQLEPILGKENFGKFMNFINDEVRKGRTFKSVLSIGKKTKVEELTMPRRIRGFIDAAFRGYDALTGKFVEQKRADIARALVEPEFLRQQLQRIPVRRQGVLGRILTGQPARAIGQLSGTNME
jgi:hypothetical protein